MTPTILLALCTLLQQPAQQAPGPETLRGAYFQVTAYFQERKLAEEALAAAEAVAKPLAPLFGSVAIERKGAVVTGERMTIHLYWANFAFGGESPKPGACAREFAFTSDTTRAGYVAITPASVQGVLGMTGLPLHTKLDVARVAGQLWAQRASPKAAAWPYWFLEGGTTWAAEEACRARSWMQKRAEYPAAASDVARVQLLDTHKGLPDLFSFVEGVPGGLTAVERQAVAGEVFRFLKLPANQELLDMLAYATRVTKQDDVQAAVAKVLHSKVGNESAHQRLDDAFVAWVRAEKPAWQELYGSLWPVGDTWIQAAAERNALSWRADVIPGEHYELAGEVAFIPAQHRQANVLLARGEHTFVQLALVADHGVDVSVFDAALPESERWKKIATGETKALAEGKFVPFRVVANQKSLEVWIEGKPLLALTDVGTTLAGAWGLGAYAGSCCAWRNVQFKALR